MAKLIKNYFVVKGIKSQGSIFIFAIKIKARKVLHISKCSCASVHYNLEVIWETIAHVLNACTSDSKLGRNPSWKCIFHLCRNKFHCLNRNLIQNDNKVEKMLKGSLDLIPSPSPSVQIQIMGGKLCLRCKGKKLLNVQQTFENKNFVDNSRQCFVLLPQVNFPANNLNLHWRQRWWDRIFSTLMKI